MNKLEERLLREYVKKILIEDTYGMVDPFGGGGMSGGTVSAGTMYDVFIKPFVDVIEVGKGKMKEMGTHVVASVKIALTAAATTFLPFLASDYNNIFKHQEAQLQKIRSEYSKVYNATWDAFKRTDFALMGFFCFPGYVLSGALAAKSPKIALGVANTLTGGELDNVLDRVAGKLDQKFDSAIARAKRLMEGSLHGNVLLEKKKTRKMDDRDKLLAELVTHPEFINEVLSTPAAQALQSDSLEIHEETIDKIEEDVKQIAAIRNAAGLRSILEGLKKNVKENTGDDVLKSLADLEKLPQNERQVAEQQLVRSFKECSKKFLVENLEKKVKSAVDAGINPESPFIKDYRGLINKINAI